MQTLIRHETHRASRQMMPVPRMLSIALTLIIVGTIWLAVDRRMWENPLTLGGIVLAVLGAHTLVMIHTILVATGSTRPATDLVRLTPIPVWRLTLAQMIGVLRMVWGWHLLVALARLGLAFAVGWHFRTVSTVYNPTFYNGSRPLFSTLMRPWVSVAYSCPVWDLSTQLWYLPVQIIVIAILTVIYAVSATSLGLLVAAVFPHRSQADRVSIALAVYGGLAVATLAVSTGLGALNLARANGPDWMHFEYSNRVAHYREDDNGNSTAPPFFADPVQYTRAIESSQAALWTTLDGGIGVSMFLVRASQRLWSTSCVVNVNCDEPNIRRWQGRVLQFALRQAAIAGMALGLLATPTVLLFGRAVRAEQRT